jgi:NAD(P)-dependent dehydrogenase (short-subunit alcohol dehydrogenase family)
MIYLTGKTAGVTGGASWISKGICIVLAEQCADVALADVDKEGSLTASKQIVQTWR